LRSFEFERHRMGNVLNSEYVIHMRTKHGRPYKYVRDEKGWTQTSPKDVVRRLSAEQSLSHLLPPLASDQPGLKIRIERRNASRKQE
jgi:hypothetical protein